MFRAAEPDLAGGRKKHHQASRLRQQLEDGCLPQDQAYGEVALLEQLLQRILHLAFQLVDQPIRIVPVFRLRGLQHRRSQASPTRVPCASQRPRRRGRSHRPPLRTRPEPWLHRQLCLQRLKKINRPSRPLF